MFYKEYETMKDFFIGINHEIIFNEKYITRASNMNLIEDIIVDIKSTGMPDFNVAPLGYSSSTKATLLYGQYIDTSKLHNLIEMCKGNKDKGSKKTKNTKNTIVLDFDPIETDPEFGPIDNEVFLDNINMPFKRDQGCVKHLILCRDNPRVPYSRVKVFFRASELSRKIVPDLFLITWLCSIFPCFELDRVTLYISQGYLVPAILANTYDIVLGLNKEMFDPDNNFQRSILCGIRRIDNHDPNKPNAGKGCYGRLEQLKYNELRGVPYKQVTQEMYFEAFRKRYIKECEELGLEVNI
jgi:hypothetical protein